MSLFQHGNFQLHSGDTSWWRIDCDDLSNAELGIFAKMIHDKFGVFHEISYPQSHYGSAAPRLAEALISYKSNFIGNGFKILIVDDVLTTGNSMNEIKDKLSNRSYPIGLEIFGAVLFARGVCPSWVTPVFQYAFA